MMELIPRKVKVRTMARTITCLKSRIGNRSLVFVGLMGAGKSTIGQCMAKTLNVPFFDSDHEVELVSKRTISEIFAIYGEQKFRYLEKRIISCLLNKQLNKQMSVLATGGGAFMNPDIRCAIRKNGLSIWLKADIDLLIERISHNNNRPLLQENDPRNVLKRLMNERYPIYAEADITVQSRNSCGIIVRDVIKATDRYLKKREECLLNEN